jgi:hypothetical protein
LVKWIPFSKRLVPVSVPVKTEQVPQEIADKALQVVAKLKDVDEYVRTLKSEKRSFGVRAEAPESTDPKKNRTWLSIFEKKEGKEILYDRFLVDIKKMKVIRRQKKPSLLR